MAETRTAARPHVAVQVLESGGYVVRGTGDVEAARDAVAAHMQATLDHLSPDELEAAVPGPLVRVGLFRWAPCGDRGCDTHPVPHLMSADGRGQGVWEGVQFGG